LWLRAPLHYNDPALIASTSDPRMSKAVKKVDRDGVAVTRTSHRREAIGLGVVAAGASAALLLTFGPAWFQPVPESSPGAGVVVHLPPHEAGLAAESTAGLPPKVVRPAVRAVKARRVDPEIEAVKTAAEARGWSGLDGAGPVVPPPGEVSDEEVRGPLSLRRLAAAVERALDRGWLTIAPPGSPPSGMALFPPMGTQPLQAGILVPDGYVVPEGYMRHYQVTDDGQQQPAILMYSPDYELVDEQGNRVPIPADRIVPPELAPPDLPPVMYEPPENGSAP
jgi:hypothetical protein